MLFKCIINLAFVDPQYTIKLYDIIILKKHISLNIITRHGIILKIMRTLITIIVNLTTIKLATIENDISKEYLRLKKRNLEY